MRERRRNYELMFVISTLFSDEDGIDNVLERVHQAIADQNGEVTSVNQNAPWGRRRLAYPIRAYAGGEASRRIFTEGYYVLMHFQIASTQVAELERALRFVDPILRFLITVVDRAPDTLDQDDDTGEAADADETSDDYNELVQEDAE